MHRSSFVLNFYFGLLIRHDWVVIVPWSEVLREQILSMAKPRFCICLSGSDEIVKVVLFHFQKVSSVPSSNDV